MDYRRRALRKDDRGGRAALAASPVLDLQPGNAPANRRRPVVDDLDAKAAVYLIRPTYKNGACSAEALRFRKHVTY